MKKIKLLMILCSVVFIAFLTNADSAEAAEISVEEPVCINMPDFQCLLNGILFVEQQLYDPTQQE